MSLVCGPPAAGKSYYVSHSCDVDDIVIDLDEIVRDLGAAPRADDDRVRFQALRKRNLSLQALTTYNGAAKRAWFITTAPKAEHRRRWKVILRSEEVLVLLTPERECMDRVRADSERVAYREAQERIIKKWWRQYTPCPEIDRIVNVGEFRGRGD